MWVFVLFAIPVNWLIVLNLLCCSADRIQIIKPLHHYLEEIKTPLSKHFISIELFEKVFTDKLGFALVELGGRIYENDDYYDIKELLRNKSLHLCNSFWEKTYCCKGHNLLYKKLFHHIGFSFFSHNVVFRAAGKLFDLFHEFIHATFPIMQHFGHIKVGINYYVL